MNQLNIVREEGFPTTRKTFEFLQQAYGSAIEHLCRMHGDNLILHGVVVGGTTISAGAVVINGELLPFEQSIIGGGGTQNARIEIVERTEPVIYQSGELLPAYVTRVARIGVGGTIPFTALRRMQRPRQQTDWVNCTPTTDITVVETIQCRINENGKVELRGSYWHGEDHGHFHDFRLPDGFIPKHNRVAVVIHAGGNPALNGVLFVRTDRQVYASGIQRGDAQHTYILNTEFDL